jgi:hypothetical protein
MVKVVMFPEVEFKVAFKFRMTKSNSLVVHMGSVELNFLPLFLVDEKGYCSDPQAIIVFSTASM